MSDDDEEDGGGGEDGGECVGEDVAFIRGRVPGGVAVVRHLPDHSIQEGILRPMSDGQSLNGHEVVRLTPREDGCCDVETIYGKPGPSMVNNRSYRDGWDRIFQSPAGRSAPN